MTIATKEQCSDSAEMSLSSGGRIPSLVRTKTWIISQPSADNAVRGEVVAVGFWTYTGIDCRLQLPQ